MCYFPVFHVQYAVPHLCELFIVGYDEEGLAMLVAGLPYLPRFIPQLRVFSRSELLAMLKHQFRDASKTYTINPDGSYKTHSFTIPALESVLARMK